MSTNTNDYADALVKLNSYAASSADVTYEQPSGQSDGDQKWKQFHMNKASMVAGFELGSVRDFDKYLESPFIKPRWDAFKTYIDSRRSGGEKTATNVSFDTLYVAYQAGEAQLNKYSDLYSDTSDWQEIDYVARCVHSLVSVNVSTEGGLLYQKEWSDKKNFFMMYNIYRYLRKNYTETKAERAKKASEKAAQKEALKDLTDAAQASSRLQEVVQQDSSTAAATLRSPAHALTGLSLDSPKRPSGIPPSTVSPVSGTPRVIAPVRLRPSKLVGYESDSDDEEKATSPSTPSKRKHSPEKDGRRVKPGDSLFGPLLKNPQAVNQAVMNDDPPETDIPVATTITVPDEDLQASDEDIQVFEEVSAFEEMMSEWIEGGKHWTNKFRLVQRHLIAEAIGKNKSSWAADRLRDADDGNATRNADIQSFQWDKENLDALSSNHVVVVAPNAQDYLDFAEQERFLNTTPEISYDAVDTFSRLSLEGNPTRPRTKGMSMQSKLMPLQVTGLDVLLKIRETYRGAMLADATGLGKTAQTIAFITKTVEDEIDAINHPDHPVDKPLPGPSLICVPPSLTDQQYKEVVKFIDSVSVDKWRVLRYHGDTRGKQDLKGEKVQGVLTQNHPLFERTVSNARTIIVTSIPTMDARHGPQAMKEHFSKLPDQRASKSNELRMEPDRNAPCFLAEKFYNVVVDEAHLIKRWDADAQAHGNWGTAMKWLEPDFYLLATATPGKNSLADWEGYLGFMLPKTMPLTENGLPYGAADTQHVNPYGDDSLPRELLVLPVFANRYVFASGVDAGLKGVYIRKIQDQICVRRSFSTKINGKTLENALPRIHKRAIDCTFASDTSAQLYRRYQEVPASKLVRADKETGKITWNGGNYRHLCLLTTWLGFEAILKEVEADNLPKMRAGGRAIIYKWLKMYQAFRLGQGDGPYDVPEEGKFVEQVQKILEDAPKIKNLLGLISDDAVLQKENVIVWTQYPAQQVLVKAILEVFNLKAAALTSDLKETDRQSMISEFCRAPRQGKVLILTYDLSSCGLNLQKASHIAYHLDVPYSQAVRDQADGRQRRTGQAHECYSWGLGLKDSFNDYQTANLIAKLTPNNITEMNPEVFQMEVFDNDLGEKACYITNMVIADGIICQQDSNIAREAERKGLSVDPADVNTVVEWLTDRMQGKKIASI